MPRKTKRAAKKPSKQTVLQTFAIELSKIPSDKEASIAGNEVLEQLAPFTHPGTLEVRKYLNATMYGSPEGNELIARHKYPDPESLPDIFRDYGPGKFDNYATKELYEEEFFDEECGEADTTNWYGLVKGPFHHPQLREFAGAILEENSQGFVVSEFYQKDAALKKTWKEICNSVSEAEGEGESDDSF